MKAGPEVLFVEDNPGDWRLYEKVFSAASPEARLSVVADGDAALAYLGQEAPYENVARPDLMIIDLNLPRRDGRELLSKLKADSTFRTIPVIVITSSDAETDIIKSYELHANCFLTKPLNLDEFLRTLEATAKFWLTVARLPGRVR
jgi:two-component system, chemotaxis family, response regulator Rcp1